jgi:hypothetical protein
LQSMMIIVFFAKRANSSPARKLFYAEKLFLQLD